jgi:hypothetical protein
MSPIMSISASKYYLVCLDDFTHYLLTFPLKLKSKTFTTLHNFHSYVLTHVNCRIQFVQSDNGRELTTMQLAHSSLNKAFIFAFLAPTHPQNGKAERVI